MRVWAAPLAAAGAAFGVSAMACIVVSGPGNPVRVDAEEAIIIWDAAAKTQHFIRRAEFTTKARNFGFLVPTPTQPQLAEADDGVFAHLMRITHPPVATADRKASLASEKPRQPEVKVLERKKVAGLDAAVLEASRPEALDQWLKQHGYPSSAELVEWYRPYVESGWKITAFKIDAQGAEQISPKAVRMSFQTDRPFFPYREPAGQRAPGGGVLRVYLLAEVRFSGDWPAKAMWSNRLEARERAQLFKKIGLPGDSAAGAIWLTEFEDRSSPRTGNDVYFEHAASQSTLDRTTQSIGGATFAIWAVGALALLTVGGFLIRGVFRRG